MNILRDHPLFPHGNKFFKNTLDPFTSKFPSQVLIRAHYLDTYATACLELGVSFSISFGRGFRDPMSSEEYSYAKLLENLSTYDYVTMFGTIRPNDVRPLMLLGLIKSPHLKVPRQLSGFIEVSGFHAGVAFNTTEIIGNGPGPNELFFDPSVDVRAYATDYLDELMFTIGDKLIYAIKPPPRVLNDEETTVHLIIRKEDVGILAPFNMAIADDTERYEEMGTTFTGGNFQLELIILLV